MSKEQEARTMGFHSDIATTPADWLVRHQPDDPVFFFSPDTLRQTLSRFQTGFPGEVTYAVKANPGTEVLATLADHGMQAFDVASCAEMAQVRAAHPGARLHYHNPVRSRQEIDSARAFGITSWSIDRISELDKLGPIEGQEIAVRLKLPVAGAAYDFGSKFGADPQTAVALLRCVQDRGGRASMTFHPGTQCDDPAPWVHYIKACADIAAGAGTALHRLNVGGGFAAHRGQCAPDLTRVFDAIGQASRASFVAPPRLVCEPGRAMIADAYTLALRVKAVSDDTVFLNDGLYGSLMEWRDLPPPDRMHAFSADGQPRVGAQSPRHVFGPTCDSLDRLPVPLPLPQDLQAEDYLVIDGMGAYANCLATAFNGYGTARIVPHQAQSPQMTGHWRDVF
ncbi:type III PLP-dependent enzyme [Tropicibacter oceani]|uniref:ornithine decarboxylase n=1 Tax=Tropicibacter oceani TaxID=3058420 RepID=A0ABY8QDX5_9RHOB|nr:type III PLP-dependent enzyme [Tropicibacter oceani]WGW02213.1 type III PLP-dependent enzyme [Tropicibacter oceani]